MANGVLSRIIHSEWRSAANRASLPGQLHGLCESLTSSDSSDSEPLSEIRVRLTAYGSPPSARFMRKNRANARSVPARPDARRLTAASKGGEGGFEASS